MFELASIGMAKADPSTGQWLRVNQKMCAITGYTAAELLKMRVPDLTHPDDRQKDWEKFQRVVRGEASDYRLEKRYVLKDGTLAWVNVNMTVIRDVAGQSVRTMATIEDITERKRVQELLRQQTDELLARNDRLKRFNQAAVGRELRMIELKREVNELCGKLGEPPRHRLAEPAAAPPAAKEAQA
jgi:PAS domain S-box-containing protein